MADARQPPSGSLAANCKRFPDDFLFELTTEEFAYLKSRFATSSWVIRESSASTRTRG